MKPTPTQMRALCALRDGAIPKWQFMRAIGRSHLSTMRALERHGFIWIMWRLNPRKAHVRLTWRGESALQRS